MPEGVTQRPKLGPVATGLGEVFHYVLSSKERSLVDLIRAGLVDPAHAAARSQYPEELKIAA